MNDNVIWFSSTTGHLKIEKGMSENSLIFQSDIPLMLPMRREEIEILSARLNRWLNVVSETTEPSVTSKSTPQNYLLVSVWIDKIDSAPQEFLVEFNPSKETKERFIEKLSAKKGAWAHHYDFQARKDVWKKVDLGERIVRMEAQLNPYWPAYRKVVSLYSFGWKRITGEKNE